MKFLGRLVHIIPHGSEIRGILYIPIYPTRTHIKFVDLRRKYHVFSHRVFGKYSMWISMWILSRKNFLMKLHRWNDKQIQMILAIIKVIQFKMWSYKFVIYNYQSFHECYLLRLWVIRFFSVHHLNPFSRGILFRKNSVNYYNKLI
jgi:hypothetical protein